MLQLQLASPRVSASKAAILIVSEILITPNIMGMQAGGPYNYNYYYGPTPGPGSGPGGNMLSYYHDGTGYSNFNGYWHGYYMPVGPTSMAMANNSMSMSNNSSASSSSNQPSDQQNPATADVNEKYKDYFNHVGNLFAEAGLKDNSSSKALSEKTIRFEPGTIDVEEYTNLNPEQYQIQVTLTENDIQELDRWIEYSESQGPTDKKKIVPVTELFQDHNVINEMLNTSKFPVDIIWRPIYNRDGTRMECQRDYFKLTGFESKKISTDDEPCPKLSKEKIHTVLKFDYATDKVDDNTGNPVKIIKFYNPKSFNDIEMTYERLQNIDQNVEVVDSDNTRIFADDLSKTVLRQILLAGFIKPDHNYINVYQTNCEMDSYVKYLVFCPEKKQYYMAQKKSGNFTKEEYLQALKLKEDFDKLLLDHDVPIEQKESNLKMTPMNSDETITLSNITIKRLPTTTYEELKKNLFEALEPEISRNSNVSKFKLIIGTHCIEDNQSLLDALSENLELFKNIDYYTSVKYIKESRRLRNATILKKKEI